MSILAQEVTKIYGKQKALDSVSFEINQGQIVGFLGPNGAGKSTMMKIITCYIPQNEGKISVCGYDVEEQSLEIRKLVGYLPEHNPLYLEMYVKEYLAFIAGIYKLQNVKKRVLEMIDLVGLSLEQNKKIGALSKGFRQRVGLAQAMIHEPKVLILDEPTSGLDPNQIVEIRNLIRNIGKEKTVMMCTHIMQEVEAICDRVIIINKGKIVADDSSENLKHITQSKSFILVEFSSTVPEKELFAINGLKSAVNTKDNNWKLEAESNMDIRNDVFQFAVTKGISVLAMQKEEQKLEDVFKELTR